ncbi:hypothetical protein [Gracilimonas sp.]|nr:hypothetical protein [Gracilimonas sp.]
MKTVKVYICNVCGKEYDTESEAIHCHPDIVIKEVPVLEYKARLDA